MLSESENSRGIVPESTLISVESMDRSVEASAGERLGLIASQDVAALSRQEAEVCRRLSGLLRVSGSAPVRFW